MSMTFLLDSASGGLTPLPSSQSLPADAHLVRVLSLQEFTDCLDNPDTLDAVRYLLSAESTYLDVYPTYYLGSFAIPNKQQPLCDPTCFAFYLDKQSLTFLEEGAICKEVLSAIAQQGMLRQPSTAHCLFEFMKWLVRADLEFLANIEDRMEQTEEDIASRSNEVSNRLLLEYRRRLLRVNTYYQQLAAMAASLADNENRQLTRSESRLFVALERRAERLLKRSQALKEYSLQLRELYQTQIDIQQNDVMKLFTVITALFAPLTLLTSWFGMNFANMPGLDAPWGYGAVIATAIALVAVELVLFKRKGWL